MLGVRSPQLGREARRRVLVDRAEDVLADVGSGEPKRLRLLRSAAHEWLQAASVLVERQDGNGERCGPEVAIMVPVDEATHGAGAVIRARHDSHAFNEHWR